MQGLHLATEHVIHQVDRIRGLLWELASATKEGTNPERIRAAVHRLRDALQFESYTGFIVRVNAEEIFAEAEEAGLTR